MKKILLTLTIAIITASFGISANAQSNWTFVRFETTVTRDDIETSDANPTERRFYVSNVVQSPSNLRSYQLPKIVDDYFTANVVEPFKMKGITHHYYENDVDMDCGSSLAAKDRADAEAKLAKCIEDAKEQGRVTVYTFRLTFNEANGLETSQPKMIFQGAESANYQPKGEKASASKTQTLPTQTTPIVQKKKTKKTKKN